MKQLLKYLNGRTLAQTEFGFKIRQKFHFAKASIMEVFIKMDLTNTLAVLKEMELKFVCFK